MSFTHPVIQTQKRAGLTRAFLRLKSAVRRRRDHMRLKTMLGVLGQDGLLALNALLSLLNVILSPLQGISLPLGFMQMMIVIALLRGQKTFWLPRRWQTKSFQKTYLLHLLDRWLPVLYRLEKLSRPRLEQIIRCKHIQLLSFWIMLFFAFIITCPIPLLNTTPAAACFFLSLGLINRDMLVWGIGFIITLAHSAIFFFWQALIPHIIQILQSWFAWM
jgi:hypothetical protein